MEEEEANLEIAYFETLKKCHKRAKRVRAWLAETAPGTAGKRIAELPLRFATGMRRNRMYAVSAEGQRVLEINLKNGVIATVS